MFLDFLSQPKNKQIKICFYLANENKRSVHWAWDLATRVDESRQSHDLSQHNNVFYRSENIIKTLILLFFQSLA